MGEEKAFIGKSVTALAVVLHRMVSHFLRHSAGVPTK